MRINNWWDGDASESFWMEITDRDDLGSALWAPQRDGGGAESWSYTLLTYVIPGDRVFHWHKTMAGEPAMVGWSTAVGPLEIQTKSWQARGTRGRSRAASVGPAWVVPLKDFIRLETPITRSMINSRYAVIIELLDENSRLARGSAYAPFQNYGGRELRAQQGYLTKFPAALVADFFRRQLTGPELEGRTPAPKLRVSRSQGYLSDAEKRGALERHAVGAARAMYSAEGASLIEELGKPYDLRVIIGGVERHVEVKGSMGNDLATVQLTQGEVLHAERWQPTDLVVVDSIVCWRDQTGSVHTKGGELRIWRNWNPLATSLTPTHLRYELPLSE